jgi:PBSX family phage terminase large subunit
MADELTDKQRVFVEEYLTCWNATEAAKRAGYSPDTAYSIGWENLRKPEIKALIDQRMKEKAMSADEVLARLSDQAGASMDDFLTTSGRGFRVDIGKGKKAGKLHLIKKVTKGKNGTSIELVDQQSALIQLGKRHRLFNGEEEKKVSSETQTFDLPARVIAPSFLDVYDDIHDRLHTEYLFFGGRGSTKSSFVSLVFVYLIKNYPTMHLLAMRQVANTLRDSVYAQIQWAINELGFEDEFKCTTSPLEIEYKATGQKIYFRGADEPGKIKSIKTQFGYIGGLWFEELDQFHGEEAIRKIEQSAIRGGDIAFIFKSFNPPVTATNWANKYVKIPKTTQYQHKSTYLDLGSRIKWLGKTFVEEAEFLKSINPKAYEHEYLGVVTGSGGMVFENVQIRKITDEEIAEFDRVLFGVDWGYYPDHYAWVKCFYDPARLTLFIFDEYRVLKASNRDTYKILVEQKHVTPGDLIIADSAEPKSIGDYREYGLSCRGAEKGPESLNYSFKWMQSLAAIVIDNERAPETATEFLDYEYERDKDGEVISGYPDKNDHSIAAARYATNHIWRRRGQ